MKPHLALTPQLDRVWGRGDGAMVVPKYTGIAVFVSPVVAPYVRLLGMYKHSFGASEGSKGGVGVALGLYDVTLAFVNTHMASKRADLRRAQYCELVDRLGSKLGGRGFGLVQSFHHVVWLGDLNTHCKGIGAKDALNLVRTGRHMQLLLQHDELLAEKEEGMSWAEFEEPLMAPDFWPTYKKLPERGPVDSRAVDWVSRVYVTAYKEPFYKGGRVAERVPSWTDRIQYHSLPDRWGELLPEPLQDPSLPSTAASLHNYRAVNDGLDCSDHSPVFATFTLEIVADDEEAEESAGVAPDSTGHMPVPGGVMPDADYSSLHPALRPLKVALQLNNIVVDYGGRSLVPRAVSLLFPLPYEDSDDIPERIKMVRPTGLLSFARTPGSDYIGAATQVTVSQARKLETMHLLLKVSLDDNSKAQAVLAMRDGGFVGLGSHMNNFLLPLSRSGTPLMVGGRQASVSFVMEMNAYERGGLQTVNDKTAGVPGQTGPVTYPPHQPGGPSAQRRGELPVDAGGLPPSHSGQAQQAGPQVPSSHSIDGSRRSSLDYPMPTSSSQAPMTAAQAGAQAAAAVASFRSPKAPSLPPTSRPPVAAANSPAGMYASASTVGASAALARPPVAVAETPALSARGAPGAGGVAATPGVSATPSVSSTPGVNNDLARARAAQMMAAARFKAATAAQANAAGRGGVPGGLGSAGMAASTPGGGSMAGSASVLRAKQAGGVGSQGSATSSSEGMPAIGTQG